MPSILVVVFLVEVAARLVNAIGAAAINSFLWTLINYLAVSTSKSAGEQRKLQAEYLQVRGDLNATSSQDEFAKWARLRRQHDKLLDKLESTKKTQEAARSKFDKYLTALRLLLTKAPQYLVPFWFAKEPMFWIPHGWFPYYAEWIISFPRAPLGSVSVASWQLACAGVIALFSDLITGIYGLVFSAKQKETPVKAGQKAATEKEKAGEEKKS
ncbi:GET complex subunit get1 [Amphichorda felina]